MLGFKDIWQSLNSSFLSVPHVFYKAILKTLLRMKRNVEFLEILMNLWIYYFSMTVLSNKF